MARRNLAALAFLLVAVLEVTWGRFVVEKGSISVISPESIRSTHDGAIANFGVPDYAATLVGVVVYPDVGRDGCAPFDTKFKAESSRPVILLLDRGGIYSNLLRIL